MQVKKEVVIRAQAMLDAGEAALGLESNKVAATLFREGLCLMLGHRKNLMGRSIVDDNVLRITSTGAGRIQAIKYVREALGITLGDAQTYVDHVLATRAGDTQ